MIINDIDFPDEILNAIKENKLVVFAGAGISKNEPTKLPDFNELAASIGALSGIEFNDRDDNPDEFLGKLEQQEIKIRPQICNRLNEDSLQPNIMHINIVNLFKKGDSPRIVTTNYDLMIDKILNEIKCGTKVYSHPALPFGDNFEGLVHLHGDVTEPNNIIVTDSDFGKAYITRKQVSNFLIDLFTSKYVVLFIGYSYQDVVMKYLTRAIPPHLNNRFILTDDEESDWSLLGLRPILFEKHNYLQLNRAVEELGTHINRGIFEWNQIIEDIGEKEAKYLEENEHGLIHNIMNDIKLVDKFLKKVNSSEWLFWLHDNGFLDFLFESDDLNNVDKELANWVIENFIRRNYDYFVELRIKQGNQLNNKFQGMIVNCVTTNKDVSKETLLKLLSVINIESLNVFDAYRLLKIIMSFDEPFYVNELFKRVIDYKIIWNKKSFNYNQNDHFSDKYRLNFKLNILPLIESEDLLDVWTGIKQVIGSYFLDVLSFLTKILSEIRIVEKTWDYKFFGAVSVNFIDSISDMNDYEVIVKIYADLLSLINHEDENFVYGWAMQNLYSDSLIFRRLSLYVLKDVQQLSNEEKLNIVMDDIGLLSFGEKQEIFHLIADLFDEISPTIKEKIVDHILNYTYVNDQINEESRKYTEEYEKYNLLYWINSRCSYHEEVFTEMERIREEYSFAPRDFPELNTSPVIVGPWERMSLEVQFSKENILKDINIAEMFEKIEVYLNEQTNDAVIDEQLVVLEKVIVEDSNLGKKLIDNLSLEGKWDSKLWRSVFRGFSKGKLNAELIKEILTKTNQPELMVNNGQYISEFLFTIGENIDEIGLDSSGLDFVFNYCVTLWDKLTDIERDSDDLIHEVLNTPKGKVLITTVNILWSKAINDKLKVLPSNYASFLENVLYEENSLVYCVLGGYYSLLKYIDSNWSSEKILPLFVDKNDEIYSSAWIGFLSFMKPNLETINDLNAVFYKGAQRIYILPENERETFVNYYTQLCILIIDNPNEKYIGRLLQNSGQIVSNRFHKTIEYYLKNNEEEKKNELWHRWLKNYLLNRLNNIPSKLTNEDIDCIYQGWLPNIGESYPELVELCIKMNVSEIDAWRFSYVLNKELSEGNFPQSTKKIIKHIFQENPDKVLEIKAAFKRGLEKLSIDDNKLDEMLDY
ncbi:SIR2 family protein [Ruoffia tabacinasalis]|uniref:DUF4020 domain-containing protein n=1 Tax=Ruoffia tabacinasalis TaxID=87458 RepID=A0ABS0LLF4_9LACT|nr:SIR2 family protein [Ruoffia tabacinasalis]MBG9979125.1 DUF4020 domain-containing protein [Ruoffia tabacinasalis]